MVWQAQQKKLPHHKEKNTKYHEIVSPSPKKLANQSQRIVPDSQSFSFEMFWLAWSFSHSTKSSNRLGHASASSYTPKSSPTVSDKFRNMFHVSLGIPRTDWWHSRKLSQRPKMAGWRTVNTRRHSTTAISVGRMRCPPGASNPKRNVNLTWFFFKILVEHEIMFILSETTDRVSLVFKKLRSNKTQKDVYQISNFTKKSRISPVFLHILIE